MFKTYSSSSSHNFPLVRDKPPGGARICETGLYKDAVSPVK